MYSLCLQRDFTARHYLTGGDWGAENNPHVHSYRIELRLEGETLDTHGYLVDLARLEPILEACVTRYRDCLLNELPEFAGLNPSIENLARLFYDRFLPDVDCRHFSAAEIRIWENGTAWASYREVF